MPNSYFEPGERRSAKVDDLFSRIARRYDLGNDLQTLGWHRYWKRRVIELAQVTPGQRALDVCCGTGDLTFGFCRVGVPAVGLDFNERMLAIAERRKCGGRRAEGGMADPLAAPLVIPHSALRIPRFIRGDAQRIPFRNDAFEVVTVGYGLRNLVDWEAGLREMQRVAKPGGRVLVLEFGKPENALLRGMYFGYLKL